MKEIFNHILRILPQPLLFALLAIAVTYFALYYHYSYQTYGDAFRDAKFRTAAIIILAIAFVFLINERPTTSVSKDVGPVLIVPKFFNDADDKCRAPFIASVEFQLDATLGRTGTVQLVSSWVNDKESAEYTLEYYGGTAILYAVSVGDVGDDRVVCLKVLTRDKGSLARFPPIPLKDPHEHINSLVLAIAGEVSKTEGASSQNPLLARLFDIETRLGQLESLIASQATGPRVEGPLPSYRNRYAIIVGVDRFEASPTHKLQSSKSDAKQLGQLLRDSYGFAVKILLDEQATKSSILSAIRSQSEVATEEDLFLFYFVGNGTELRSDKTQSGRVLSIVPYDFKWESNHFSILELTDALRNNLAKHKLLLIDACHATSGAPASTSPPSADANPSDPVFQILGASKANQTSVEMPNGGVFSQALIRVLSDAAVQHEDGLWITDLHSRVKTIVDEGGFAQTTTLIRASGSGEIALKPQNAEFKK